MSTKKDYKYLNKIPDGDNSSFTELLMNGNRKNKTNIKNKVLNEQITNRNFTDITRHFKMNKNDEKYISRNNQKRDLNKLFDDNKRNYSENLKNYNDEEAVNEESSETDCSNDFTESEKLLHQLNSEKLINSSEAVTVENSNISNGIEEEFLNNQSTIPFDKLEEYDYTSLPWPVKNKYIELLKIHGFPFEEIGPFNVRTPKHIEKSRKITQTLNPPIKEAVEEGNELFRKVGYERQIVTWLERVFNATPKPIDPYNYLKNYSTVPITSRSENLQLLEKLKHILAFENELAFELAQIKLLCGIIDDEKYSYDGRSKQSWDNEIKEMEELKTKIKLECLLTKLKKIIEEINEEKKRIKAEKLAEKQKVRNQILTDLQLWRNFVSPQMETFTRDKMYPHDDGRIRDWFQYLRMPVDKGYGQAPVYEIDDEEAVREPPKEDIDQPVDSSFLYEDYSYIVPSY